MRATDYTDTAFITRDDIKECFYQTWPDGLSHMVDCAYELYDMATHPDESRLDNALLSLNLEHSEDGTSMQSRDQDPADDKKSKMGDEGLAPLSKISMKSGSGAYDVLADKVESMEADMHHMNQKLDIILREVQRVGKASATQSHR